jgi:hypothetical protein
MSWSPAAWLSLVLASLLGTGAAPAQAAESAAADSAVYVALLAHLCGASETCFSLRPNATNGTPVSAGYISRALAAQGVNVDSAWLSRQRADAETRAFVRSALLPGGGCAIPDKTAVVQYRKGVMTCTPASPNGTPWLAFSRVMYDRDGTVALVYRDMWCGLLCGHTDYYALRRSRSGQWQVVARVALSASYCASPRCRDEPSVR